VLLTIVLVEVVAAPLAFGATQAWSICGVQVVSALAAALWLLSGPSQTRLLWLPVAGLALMLVQLVPLPESWLATLSPLAYRFRIPPFAGELPLRCASLNPGATLDAGRELFAFSLLAIMVADLAKRARARLAIGWTLTAIGVVILLLGFWFAGSVAGVVLGLHDMRGGQYFWINPLLDPVHSAGFGSIEYVNVGGVRFGAPTWGVGDAFGPYVSSNAFAGGLELTLPIALGLALGLPIASRLGRIARSSGLFIGCCGALYVTGYWAGSRGGAISLLLALMVTACLAADTRRRRIAWAIEIGLLPIAAAVLIWLAGQQSLLVELLPVRELQNLALLKISFFARVDAWRITLALFNSSPLLGVGLGAYGRMQFADKLSGILLYYAHNDYVQFAAETGVAGLLCASAMVMAFARRLLSGWRAIFSPQQRGLGAGLTGALSGFALHSAFDWNMHVPANALLLTVLVGTLWGIAAKDNAGASSGVAAETQPRAVAWPARIALCGVLALVVASATLDYLAARWIQPLREAEVRHRVAAMTQRPLSDFEDLRESLPQAERAAAVSPANAEIPEVIGWAYLHLSQQTGRDGLLNARHWFLKSLRLCPAHASLRETLVDLDAALAKPEGR